MSTKQASKEVEPRTKKFGKGERTIPHSSQKAKKFYPAEDESKPRKVRKSIRPARPRPSLQPGSILILLAGRFRGKRVVLLKHLPQGVLLVTGPFKVNGVPLRRVNSRYVITTSVKVDLKGVDEKVVDKVGGEGYFTRDKPARKTGEEQFFKQREKPEVSLASNFLDATKWDTDH
ncbi:60S ribosomal protein L6 [Lecanora helva]